MPDVKTVREFSDSKEDGVSLICEVWKLQNRSFDPHNYASTFKGPIDKLINKGYIEDDNYRFVREITYTGGSIEYFKKRCRIDKTQDDPINSGKITEKELELWWDFEKNEKGVWTPTENSIADTRDDILIRILVN